jgi:hypothetical protein
MSFDDTLVVYSVKVKINNSYTFRVRTYSNENAEEVLLFYYYSKLSHKQADPTKYEVTRLTEFKDTDQLCIALQAYEYVDRYPN